MTPTNGWTSDGVALVERAVQAHGGQAAWQAVHAIRLGFESGHGPLLALKGFGRTFPAPREYEVLPHSRTTLFHAYPDEGHRGRYADGTVSIERARDQSVVADSPHHRRTMSGLTKYRRWSPLDALYFFGYALTHYCRLPFTLADARLLRVISARGRPIGLDVEFPASVATHCRRQQFYFDVDGDGRILRHDYVAEVVGRWARGSHFWEDYAWSNGLLLARRRRVVVRAGRFATPLPVLDIRLSVATPATLSRPR